MSFYGVKKIDYKNNLQKLERSYFSGLKLDNNGTELLSDLLNYVNAQLITKTEQAYNSVPRIYENTFYHCAKKAIENVFVGSTEKEATAEAFKQLALLKSGCMIYEDDLSSSAFPEKPILGQEDREQDEYKRAQLLINQFQSGVIRFSSMSNASIEKRAGHLLGLRIYSFGKIVAEVAARTYNNKDELLPADIKYIIAKYLEKNALRAANSEGNKCLLLYENGLLDFSAKRKIKYGWSKGKVIREEIFASVFKPCIKTLLMEINPNSTIDSRAPQFLGHILTDVALYLAQSSSEMCKRRRTNEMGSEDLNQSVRLTFPEQLKQHALLKASDDVGQYHKGFLVYEREPDGPKLSRIKIRPKRKSPKEKERIPAEAKKPEPKKKISIKSKKPSPKKKISVKSKKPSPKKKIIASLKKPLPKKKIPAELKEPLPKKKIPAKSREPLPEKKISVKSKKPSLKRKIIARLKKPLPKKRIPAESKEPLPNKTTPAKSKKPLPKKKIPVESGEPLPEKKIPVESKEPLPKKNIHAESKEPLPKKNIPAKSRKPLSEEKIPVESKEPLSKKNIHAESKESLPKKKIPSKSKKPLSQKKIPIKSKKSLPKKKIPAESKKTLSKKKVPTKSMKPLSKKKVPTKSKKLVSKKKIKHFALMHKRKGTKVRKTSTGRSQAKVSTTPSIKKASKTKTPLKSSKQKETKTKETSNDVTFFKEIPTSVRLNFAPAISDILPAVFENAHISLTKESKSNLCNILEDACDALVSVSISVADSDELNIKEIKTAVDKLFPKQIGDLAIAFGLNVVQVWEEKKNKVSI